MPTPSKLNPFGFSRLQIIVMLAIPAVFISLYILIWVKGSPPCTAPAPMVKHTASANAVWKKGGFYIANSDRNPPSIVSLNHIVVLIENCNKVVALDGQTGEELWTARYSGYDGGLAISPTTVFVSHGSSITTRDVETGWFLWNTGMLGGKQVDIMRVQGDTLYAGNSYLYTLLDVQTGWALDSGNFLNEKYPPSEVFPAQELQAVDPWLSADADAVVGNIGYWSGTDGVAARNISNGNELWFSNIHLISPIAVTGNSIGDLMCFDSATGAAYVKIHFTPAPTAHFFQGDEYDYNNFVSVDPETNMAYVYLGDSETLAAYQLNP
jgi:outer membrane protein assembly factor BamB